MTPVENWVLDSSVFVNFRRISRLSMLVRVRRPITIPEYVFRFELTGPDAHRETRAAAHEHHKRRDFRVESLSLTDLAILGGLQAPRAVGLGEASCVLIAARMAAGVLCDDMRSRRWLEAHFAIAVWERTEEILIAAAHQNEVTEYDLDELQEALARNRYRCAGSLRTEYLQQRLSRRS